MITKCTVTKKGVDKDGWNCAWCGDDFVPVHATRAVTHVLKIRNEGIAICKAAIPDANRERYLALRTEGTAKGAARKRAREINEDIIMERQESVAVARLEGREPMVAMRTGGASVSSASSSLRGYVTTKPSVSRKTSSVVDLVNQPSIEASVANYSQTDIRQSNNTKLQMAIADLWHCENFPDRAVESARFKLVIKYARLVGSDFKIPTRRSIGGELLTLNYKGCYEHNKEDIMKEVSPCITLCYIVARPVTKYYIIFVFNIPSIIIRQQ